MFLQTSPEKSGPWPITFDNKQSRGGGKANAVFCFADILSNISILYGGECQCCYVILEVHFVSLCRSELGIILVPGHLDFWCTTNLAF